MKKILELLKKGALKVLEEIKDFFIWIFSNIIKGIVYIWKKYPEIYTIPIAFIIFLGFAKLVILIDPTSGIYDGGYLQIPFFAILVLFLFLSMTWVIMGLLFGTARKFLSKDLKESFKELSSWEKIKYSTGIFFMLLFSLVLLAYIH